MSHDTTIETTDKPKRKPSVALTDRHCERRVEKRTKFYDAKCPGLYVSITTQAVATFSCAFWDRAIKKQRPVQLGAYHREIFTVENARTKVHELRARLGNGENIFGTLRQEKEQAVKRGVTVKQVIAEYVEWIQTPVEKRDRVWRPRKKSWNNVASYLRRYVSPRLGHMIASEVTNADIAKLSDDILEGKLGKPSKSCARHMRTACSAMFTWAASPQRGYVISSPCVNLDDLPEEFARTRVLTEDEIRTLWHGLDRKDLPWDRRTCLAIKFALVTMLRSWEMLGIERHELNPEFGTVDIAACRVKKERVINQPLSDLALEIITEAMGDNEFAFVGRFGDAPMERKAMATALRGTKVRGKVKTPGICALLGLAPFTPHDLRRTAATMCGELEDVSDYAISLCLDHQATKDKDGNEMPTVTNKHYNLATRKRVNEKRKVLDRWAIELRRIISEPATELRLAA